MRLYENHAIIVQKTIILNKIYKNRLKFGGKRIKSYLCTNLAIYGKKDTLVPGSDE